MSQTTVETSSSLADNASNSVLQVFNRLAEAATAADTGESPLVLDGTLPPVSPIVARSAGAVVLNQVGQEALGPFN